MDKAETARYIKNRAITTFHAGQYLEATLKSGKKNMKHTTFNPREIPLTKYFRGTLYWLHTVKPVEKQDV